MPRTSTYLFRTERQEQKQFVARCRNRESEYPCIQDMHSIPNDVRCSINEGKRLNNMGRKKGVCDLFLPVPSGTYHGLYLEFKAAEGGNTSAEQKLFIFNVRSRGYAAIIPTSCDEAWDRMIAYLEERWEDFTNAF